MTTLKERPNTALLVIDVQNGVVEGAYDRDGVVGRIGQVVEKARTAGVPVVWIQHSADHLVQGTPEWEYVPELVRAEGEPVVSKKWGDSFEETDLEQLLAARGVGSLVVTGAQTDECVRSTLHGALVRGYDALLVSDAHTTKDLTEYGAPLPSQVIAHTNLYWHYQSAPGRSAGTTTAADLDFD